MRLDELKGAQTLYVSRKVKNTDDIVEWAKSQGLPSMLDPSDLHVTICYSTKVFEWADMKRQTKELRVKALDEFPEDEQPVRKIEMFGKDKNVLVIQFESPELTARHKQFRKAGASSDFPVYQAHVTITYKGDDLKEEAKTIEPYRGEIIFGPEIFKPIDTEWSGDADEIALTESRVADIIEDTEGLDLTVWTDVRPRDLAKLAAWTDLRGLATEGGVYVWHASKEVHYGVKCQLYIEDAMPFYVVARERDPLGVSGRSEWATGRPDFTIDGCQVYCGHSGFDAGDFLELPAFARMVGEQPVLAEGKKHKKDDPEELPGRFWYNPETERFLDCKDLEHDEYAAKHHRKMKLPTLDVAEIIDDGDAVHEFEELALECDWVKGDGSTVTASSVPTLHKAVAYFVERWPGEKMTLILHDRWRTEVPAIDLETFINDLMLPDMPLDESAESPAPRKFWLVFDLPTNTRWDMHRASEQHDILQGLGKGVMRGVTGISGTREIVGQFLAVARNAALVMDGEAVLAQNRLEQIVYTDPDYMVGNNMDALYRIWDKRRDRLGHMGMMQNLSEYVVSAMKNISPQHAQQMDYYGFSSRIGTYWKAKALEGETISTMDELRDFFWDAVQHVSNDDSQWRHHLKTVFADLDRNDVERAVYRAVAKVGSVYADEGEWLVRAPAFHVPEGSTMLIVVHKKIMDGYPAWKAGELSAFDAWSHSYAYEALDQIYEFIREFEFDKRYDIRFIDAAKFDKVRGDVLTRRNARNASRKTTS